jgi:hypothetical protein
MAACLRACFGASLAQLTQHTTCSSNTSVVTVVSKLGGQVLAKLVINKANQDVVELVQDKVVQVMPHELGLLGHCVVVEFDGDRAFVKYDEEIARRRLDGLVMYSSLEESIDVNLLSDRLDIIESNICVYRHIKRVWIFGFNTFPRTLVLGILGFPNLTLLSVHNVNEDVEREQQEEEEQKKEQEAQGVTATNRHLVKTLPTLLDMAVELENLCILCLVGCKGLKKLPTQLGNLAKLTHLSVTRSQVAGTIPSEIAKLKRLTKMNFKNNDLTGAIPSSLGELPNLQSLYLRGNKLSGKIPAKWGRALLLLDLSNNLLTGSIPTELGRVDCWLENNLLSW